MASRQSPDNTADASPRPSSPRSPLNEEQPGDLALDRPIAIEEQQILHLVPCSWQEFLELDPPSSGLYDYVDGLVVWTPNMADADHNGLVQHGSRALECSNRVSVFPTPSVQILTSPDTLEWTRTHQSNATSRDRASSSSERAPSQYDMRHPDFAITSARRDSAGSSSTSRDPQVKKRIQYPYPYTRDLLALGEITSESTRNIDLNSKWTAYARSRVPLYIILDRGTDTKPKRVIVGSLEPLEGAEQSVSGDHQESPPVRRTRATTPPPSYYRKVYHGEDKVDCRFFSKLKLTVAELLDLKFMWTLATKMDNQRRRRAQQTEIAEQERDEERRKREKSERERDEDRRRRMEAEESERERDEERRKREKSERERDEERRRRMEAEEKLKKLDMERNEQRRQRRAGSDVDREKREGKSGNPEGEGKKAQAVKKGSPSSSSSKSGSPVHKKSRK